LTAGAEQIIKPIVTLIAVPVFFLCDGVLFARARILKKTFYYRRYLIDSARRLLIPWILFSLFYLATRWVFEAAGVLRQELVVGREPTSILIEVYGSAIAPQMYFLLSLFLIRALTVFFRHLATAQIAIVWVVSIAYAFLFREVITSPLRNALPIDLDPLRHAFWGLQYYLAGILLARYHIEIVKKATTFAFSAFAVCGLAVALGGLAYSPGILQYSSILCAYFVFLAATSRESFLSRMGQNSMGIYLLHAPVILKVVSLIIGLYIAQPIFSYAIVVLGTTAVAYLVTLLVRQIPFGRMIFGEFSKESK
jgi:surface polysaccharide O-acyltransferase-like enzyme